MHVAALKVFDKLRLHHLCVGHLTDFDGDDFFPGDLRGTETLRSEDDFIALVLGSNKQGSENALRVDTAGKLFQKRLIEDSARVGGRLGKHGDGKLTRYVVGDSGVHSDKLLSSGCTAWGEWSGRCFVSAPRERTSHECTCP